MYVPEVFDLCDWLYLWWGGRQNLRIQKADCTLFSSPKLSLLCVKKFLCYSLRNQYPLLYLTFSISAFCFYIKTTEFWRKKNAIAKFLVFLSLCIVVWNSMLMKTEVVLFFSKPTFLAPKSNLFVLFSLQFPKLVILIIWNVLCWMWISKSYWIFFLVK